MGYLYTGWGVRIWDDVFVYGIRFSYRGWGFSIQDGVLVYRMAC